VLVHTHTHLSMKAHSISGLQMNSPRIVPSEVQRCHVCSSEQGTRICKMWGGPQKALC